MPDEYTTLLNPQKDLSLVEINKQDNPLLNLSEEQRRVLFKETIPSAVSNSIYKAEELSNHILNRKPIMEDTNNLLEQQNSKIDNLQNKLETINFELKQANDKVSSQNLYIKELKTDLKEASLKQELAESKLSAKDWKVAVISFIFGLILAGVGFWLNTL